MDSDTGHVIVIGAGIGGLATALRLAHAGCAVTVLEAQDAPGGKMRTLPSAAGPVDAGPTVLTLRPVFETLFRDCGLVLSDHVTLEPLDILARHYWPDGTSLDLMADPEASAANIAATFGTEEAKAFRLFSARAARLFDAFEGPMMWNPAPTSGSMMSTVLRRPGLIRDMVPHRSLAGLLRQSFRSPQLRQLFGRYATYVGGMPGASPALLSLIWQAEARGVWAVRGGMQALATAIARLAAEMGAVFRYGTPALRIVRQGGRVAAVETAAGLIRADAVVFNGDPRALHQGLLGENVRNAVPRAAVAPRSLSAFVHAFAARPAGPPLAYHTVFFGDDPDAEFAALARGQVPRDATLYLCAQDHGQVAADALQRFEIIMNAPPDTCPAQEEIDTCQTQVLARLRDFGLSFDPRPASKTLTTPAGFDALFPASGGALYGRSPHGMTAGLKRPQARTAVPGLYLCGGGAHPGAGVPMATLSARHAAAAIMTDLASTLTSRPTAMRGGMWTGSATAARKQSLS